MPTSKLVLADAATCKTLYDAAVPTIQTYWPTPVTVLPLATWQSFIALGGWKVTATNGTMRGFIITPRRPTFDGFDAEEMFIWISPASLSNAVFASSTKELFTAWWTDLLNRGIPRGWGINPPQYPTRTENWFQNAVTQGGMTVTVRPQPHPMPELGLGTINWRVVVMTPAAALAGLANL